MSRSTAVDNGGLNGIIRHPQALIYYTSTLI